MPFTGPHSVTEPHFSASDLFSQFFVAIYIVRMYVSTGNRLEQFGEVWTGGFGNMRVTDWRTER